MEDIGAEGEFELWGPERLMPGASLVACLCILMCLVNSSPLAGTLAPALTPPVSLVPYLGRR